MITGTDVIRASRIERVRDSKHARECMNGGGTKGLITIDLRRRTIAATYT